MNTRIRRGEILEREREQNDYTASISALTRLKVPMLLAPPPQLAAAEAERVSDQELLSLSTKVLSDEPRLGTQNSFSVEQVVQIVAIACETPQESSHPVSHWSARELAEEAVLRGIVEKVSPRSVGRFLKGGYSPTSP